MCWEYAEKTQQKTQFLRQLFKIKISPVELDHPVVRKITFGKRIWFMIMRPQHYNVLCVYDSLEIEVLNLEADFRGIHCLEFDETLKCFFNNKFLVWSSPNHHIYFVIMTMFPRFTNSPSCVSIIINHSLFIR